MSAIFNWIHQQLDISHGRNNTIGAMEGLRGLAVILVFFVHYSAQVKPYINPETLTGLVLPYIEMGGNIGVDLFFVLSGYLIYGALIKHQTTDWRKYASRRFWRIYPTFAVVLVLYLILSIAIPSQSKLPADALKALILIAQNALLMPGLFDVTAINTVTWSLSYEVWFYAVIPVVIGITGMRNWQVNTRIAFWCVLTVLLAALFYFVDGPKRILMFISGIILLECHRHKTFKLPKFIGLVCLLIACVFYGLKRPLEFSGIWPVLMLYMLFFVLCLEAFTRDDGSARLLNFRPLRYLGNMSYSYYLIHSLALKAVFFVLAVVMPASGNLSGFYWLAILPCFVVTCVASFGLFVVVERRAVVGR